MTTTALPPVAQITPMPTARPRVLVVLTRFLAGGSERDMSRLMTAMSDGGLDVHLVIGKDSNPEAVGRLCSSISWSMESHLRRAPSPIHDTLALTGLVRTMRKGRYDAVITCQSKAGIIGRLAARLAGVPDIFHFLSMANFGKAFGKAGPLYLWAERASSRWTRAYFVVGEDLRDRYLNAGISTPDRYVIVRSGIDIAEFCAHATVSREAARKTLGLEGSGPVLAYIGGLQARKGVLELPEFLRAASRLSTEPPTLLIAGDGEEREELERRFKAAGLEQHVRILGNRDDVPMILAAADSLALLSRAEGLPQILVQAAAVQTPFVAYPVDGANELLARGVSGAVVPFGAVEDAARAAMQFVGSRPSEAIDLTEWDRALVQDRFMERFNSYFTRSDLQLSLN